MSQDNKRAQEYDEIKPLIALCKAGRLFDVQKWIADGKPVNPPLIPKKARLKCPLQFAIESGFHSIVQVLLEGDAIIQERSFNALDLALSEKRLDLIKLLVKHGADIKSVGMGWVFYQWEPAIIDYFIEQGADVETDDPLAEALCDKIRTALGVYKRYKERFPSFRAQLNIALRHHCREGNMKWVSLVLWAGGDPCSRGAGTPGEEPYPEGDLCALELAAESGHLEVLQHKKIKLIPDHPVAAGLLENACKADSADVLYELLKNGFDPGRNDFNNYENHASNN